MDRVLIVSDEVVFASHIEKTLKEVGFEVAIQSSEHGLQQAIVNFNPDIIVAKGGSPKLSTMRVGQQLKDILAYPGKVILIVSKDQNIDPDDINRVKMDYLLFEPVGAVKVVSHVLSLIPEKKDAIRLRLQKLTESDANFRKQEELLMIPGASTAKDPNVIHVSGGKVQKDELAHVKSAEPYTPEELLHVKSNIESEIASHGTLSAKKIEAYNKAIGNLDVDLKKGHKKRQTIEKQKGLRKQLLVDPGQEKLDSLDEDRRKFATALMKKK